MDEVTVEQCDRELYKFILDAPFATCSRIDNMPDDTPELQAIAKHRTRPSQPGEESALASGPLPVAYYLWLATIEPDVRVRDLTADEAAGLVEALRTPVEAVPDDVERGIRIAIWNACKWQGKPDDVIYSLINRAMAEPAMRAALSSIPALPSEKAQIVAWMRNPPEQFLRTEAGHSDLWDVAGETVDSTLAEFRSFLRQCADAIERGDHLPAPHTALPSDQRPIMLQIAAADEAHQMWERRWRALGQMYAPQRPCFVDRDGDWCLRDFLDYAGQACGFTGSIPAPPQATDQMEVG
jgi:hypothetical protein